LKFQGGTFASAAFGLRATAAGGGDKGAKKLGSRLPWRKRSEAGRLSGNPEEQASKKEWQRAARKRRQRRRQATEAAGQTLAFAQTSCGANA